MSASYPTTCYSPAWWSNTEPRGRWEGREMSRETEASDPRHAAGANRGFSALRERAFHPQSFLPLALGAARGVAVAGALASLAASPLHANPRGGQVSVGTAVITQTSPSRLDIVQSTDRAGIDWQSFSIAPGEHTNFQQPAPSSITLNRVAPGDPSVIGGRLTANGGVGLGNPSGNP